MEDELISFAKCLKDIDKTETVNDIEKMFQDNGVGLYFDNDEALQADNALGDFNTMYTDTMYFLKSQIKKIANDL